MFHVVFLHKKKKILNSKLPGKQKDFNNVILTSNEGTFA